MNAQSSLPLRALRIIDLCEGSAEQCGRLLADLGAEVIRVESPVGSPTRLDDIRFALGNINKYGLALDLDTPSGRAELLRLAADADIVLESFTREQAEARRLTPDQFFEVNPGLALVSITDFGLTGPQRDYAATEDVLAAAGGVLSRSGLPGHTPLLPPAGVVAQTVGVHAAWAALVAYVKSVRTGVGEHVDVSALESVVHGFDPGFGTQGSAAAGRADTYPRDRPDAANFYPIYPCADGHVRICLLAKRQWHAMFDWLGKPSEFADPRFDQLAARFDASDRLNPLIKRLFAARTRDELEAEGSTRGIPIAGILTVDEVLHAEHFTTTNTLVHTEIAEGVWRTVPSGYVTLDGVPAGIRRRAPRVGEHNDLLPLQRATTRISDLGLSALSEGCGPLQGLRVLDLGVIVFGAELGRLFADQGADVIKVENRAFPDGLRQTRKGRTMNASFAWGHRNKRSLGLDLRSASGVELLRELVAEADLVAANFKPGTLESLGFSRNQLADINPRVVVLDSSAFGNHGPWSTRMGYGPLVRASCGLSTLWRDPDADPADPAAFCDGSTVYPDHIAAHVGAVSALAAIIGRAATGLGQSVEVPQVNVALGALGRTLAAAPLDVEAGRAQGNRRAEVPSGVYPCAGDDEWCVISVRDDADWARLVSTLGWTDEPELHTLAGRTARRTEVEQRLADWTATCGPQEVERALQAAGIPAAVMLRLPDELTHAQLAARDSFATLDHPLLTRPVPTSARIARFSTIPDPPRRPAPQPGEHTRAVCAALLRMEPDRIDELVADGVLQPHDEPSPSA
ncbi:MULTISPECIES: CaiB/BaiF CoA-transferase family protein [unclassified Mycolicibacterium]|uniref:CaiB/BaiF CoA transferase family protein n=1 Tax=unclassified Mycolicibacterium TaxID=2636767 RepID=UPI0012DCAE1A|nr:MULTISPECIES: CoA transferase [unclassified Mycolicibacterium]MUL82326.1 CoA transferase [Mycolicibacterium sp. CBMA 329]MUL88092.1 CoA transferase [Mycolicibacterium sp. CBMA 331]MUM02422.1 CoA transferase [Mycolicibacterium sp. CBMA 334]MUM24825.1 CoA transferase [Mycolicibacterium sp. CBMA 295]MUM38389.1 CoA transferase [Mycolicibacterium sp. CBMA 247]